MAFSAASQGVIILTTFFLPILTYLFWIRHSEQSNKKKNVNKKKGEKRSAGPLPPPTEITKIFIHPIKSCHGLTVKKAKLLPTGLDLDRQWMWVTYPDCKFLTIRTLSKMTLIRPTYDPTTDTLTVTAPSPASLSSSSPTTTSSSSAATKPLHFTIPAHPTPTYLSTHTTPAAVEIWGKRTKAHVYPSSLTSDFSAFFGKEVRLVYKPPFPDADDDDNDDEEGSSRRKLVSNGAEAILGRKGWTCFPDLMPVLIGCESSLAELNSRLSIAERKRVSSSSSSTSSAEDSNFKIGVDRFRPNILVKGTTPWDEDRWKTVRIIPSTSTSSPPPEQRQRQPPITIDITQRCARCQVPNVDPETATKHPRQSWNELVTYRRVDEGFASKPCFGMLGVPREADAEEKGVIGEVEVGMVLEVLEVTDEHRIVK